MARSCATRNASHKDYVCESTIPAGINRPPSSKTISSVTRVPSHLNTLSEGILDCTGALTFGYGCTVYVRVDVGAGDAEVDVIYISFT